jgi:sec-independent protein translocase protein TatB
MFGVDTSELLLIAVIALIFIGPKDLPRAMRTVGHWVGKVRGMARHFNSGIEAMVREAELEEMEAQWRAENERIMREFPGNADVMMPNTAALPAPVADEEPPLPLDEPEQPPPERRPLP